MNKYDLQIKNNRELKKEFLSSKTKKEIDNIQPIIKKFLNSKEGITKKEYSKLIDYYFNINIINYLNYDNYKYGEYLHMNYIEQQIYRRVLKRCIMF